MTIYSIANVGATGFPFRAGTWAATYVAAALTSGALIGANASRAGLMITNNSNADLYIKCGTTAVIATGATANFDRIIPAKMAYSFEPNEIPTTAVQGIWVGTITGGAANISESA